MEGVDIVDIVDIADIAPFDMSRFNATFERR